MPGVKPRLASKGLQQEEIVLIVEGPARPVRDFGSAAMALSAGKQFYSLAHDMKSHRKKERNTIIFENSETSLFGY